MSYKKYYPGGWQSGESGGTPITPEALNHIENGIKQTYSDFAPAQEDASFPGCYYRMVNGIKEWINPPMIPGVEYRTTERYNGYPVYAILVSLGSFMGTQTVPIGNGYHTPVNYVATATISGKSYAEKLPEGMVKDYQPSNGVHYLQVVVGETAVQACSLQMWYI